LPGWLRPGMLMSSTATVKNITWKYAFAPTLIVLFLACYPQINIWLAQGSTWNGAYVVSNYDEVAYSAYVNSLIDGRPRKNDPFTGRDDVQTESLYSIQFIPAYAIAIPSRVLGLSASTAFLVLNFLIAILSCLALFFLLRAITKDDLTSAVGTVAVLCLGTAVAFQGELQHRILGNYLCDFFPFLRRYQPGLAFPMFFVFCISTWKMFTDADKKKALFYALMSGLIFAILVFSYYFLWTAALAWLGCFAVLWFVARKEDRQRLLHTGVIGGFAAVSIIPYFLMLANRPQNMDDTQLLSYTRIPNLLEIPEAVGALIAIVIFLLVRKGMLVFSSPAVLFTLSLALTPFVLFNQQIVTGRSLQPVHYELFIANYLTMIAIILTGWLTAKAVFGEAAGTRLRRGVIYFGLAAVIWGFIESTATATRNAGYESLRDDAMPVLKYLHEQQKNELPVDGRYRTVISTNLMVADFIPTVTSYRSLWNPHTNSAGGVTAAENKELFHRYLYYSGFSEENVAKALDENLFEVKAAFFGGGRALSELDKNAAPITRAEAADEIKNYGKFRDTFDRIKATDPVLSYIIVPTKAEPDFQKLDQWYQRDEGKEFGLFKLYKLRLKS
jgi:hypothetical protein